MPTSGGETRILGDYQNANIIHLDIIIVDLHHIFTFILFLIIWLSDLWHENNAYICRVEQLLSDCQPTKCTTRLSTGDRIAVNAIAELFCWQSSLLLICLSMVI